MHNLYIRDLNVNLRIRINMPRDFTIYTHLIDSVLLVPAYILIEHISNVFNLNVSLLHNVSCKTRSDLRRCDVMFEFACDQHRFTVKGFNVGLRKRGMAEH